MILSAPEGMSQHLKEVLDGCYDIPELTFENPPVILDIGANVGSFSVWANKRWPESLIFCYEPNEGNFELLVANTKHLKNARLNPVAVTNHRGKGLLYPGPHNCGEESLYPVPSLKDPTGIGEIEKAKQVDVISGQDLPPCDILKIDTEGSEWDILSTYSYLADVKAVVFEWHKPEHKQLLSDLLQSHGFNLYADIPTQYSDRGLMKWAKGIKRGVSAKDVKLLIACPCYGGQTYWTHNVSVINLILELKNLGVDHELHYLPNESLIPRARNRFGTMCIDRDFTHLLFLDVDIGFAAKDIVSMIAWDKDIMALPYSAKDFDFKKIVKAVKKGCSDPETLKRCAGRPIINVDRATTFSLVEPVQFPQLGTGVLLIKRKVFEKLSLEDGRKYTLMQGEKFGDQEFAYDFFRTGIDPDTNHYLSEDYAFCLDCRRAGFETWLWPNAVTTHTGNMQFILDISAQAQMGIDLTENPEESEKS